ncbi:hypothetical protein P9209_18435 [Prescottella defluvii]|nr:hypothetical protein P9209_18435 [Prescottella defluvii]
MGIMARYIVRDLRRDMFRLGRHDVMGVRVRGSAWLPAMLAAAGVVFVLVGFGALSFLGVGSSATALCVSVQDSVSDGGPVYKATRLWLPVVGASCTYAESSDVHVQRFVFDWPASVTALAGWALVAISAVWGHRRASH